MVTSSKLLGRIQQAKFLSKLYEKQKKKDKVQNDANPHPNWKEKNNQTEKRCQSLRNFLRFTWKIPLNEY